jgi:hypothetical protein
MGLFCWGIGIVLGLMIVVSWMTCAWRAMLAHAKLAESVQKLSRNIIGTNN